MGSEPKPLTKAQAALVERMRGPQGRSRLLITYLAPGAEDRPHRCYIEAPYSDEDGRTVGSLIDRKVLISEGGDLWALAPQYLTPEPPHAD